MKPKPRGRKFPRCDPRWVNLFRVCPFKRSLRAPKRFTSPSAGAKPVPEFAGLLSKVSGVDHQRAELRVLQCEVELGGKLDQLSEIQISDPELDAERIFSIAQAHRGLKLEAQMLDDVEQLQKRFPQSSWTAEALFGAGNFYWVNLDRVRAAEFYRRSLGVASDGRNAPTAEWRLAWTAYLDRKPEAADTLEAYVRRFPQSSYVQDALYWIGRAYERTGNTDRARYFYLADANRFPLTYFGAKAAERLRPVPEGIGLWPVNPADFSLMIPAAPLCRRSISWLRLPRRKSARLAHTRSAILPSIPRRNLNIAPHTQPRAQRNF